MTNHLVTRTQARAITQEIEAAVAGIFEKHGLDAPKVKTTYGDRYAVKLESSPVEEGEGGVNLNTPEAKAFALHAQFSGVDSDALGKEFQSRGDTFRLTGFNTRAPKYPFQAVRLSDGRTYKFPEETIRRAFPAKVGA